MIATISPTSVPPTATIAEIWRLVSSPCSIKGRFLMITSGIGRPPPETVAARAGQDRQSLGDQCHQGKIKHAHGDVDLEGPEGLPLNGTGLISQVCDGDHRCQGGILDQLRENAGERWNDGAHRLRIDDEDHGLKIRQAAGERRLPLSSRDAANPRSYDLGDIGARIKREAEDAAPE